MDALGPLLSIVNVHLAVLRQIEDQIEQAEEDLPQDDAIGQYARA